MDQLLEEDLKFQVSFDVAETKDLANVLKAGKLPASAEIVQSEVVGPSLGQEAIDAWYNFIYIRIFISIVYGWYSIMVKQVGMLILHYY